LSVYKELMQVYPEAKVLLSVRDPLKWSRVSITIYQVRAVTRFHLMLA